DAQGNMVVAGFATGTDFPATSFMFSPASLNPSTRHGFITVINGPNLIYSTLFGGAGTDIINVVKVGSDGRLHVVGRTTSNGVATAGAYQTFRNPGGQVSAAFYAVVDSNFPGAPGLSYMTYLTAEDARAFALDGTGKAVIAGGTERGLSPVTPGAFP